MGGRVRLCGGSDIESFSRPAMRTWMLGGKKKVEEKKRNAGSNESLKKCIARLTALCRHRHIVPHDYDLLKGQK